MDIKFLKCIMLGTALKHELEPVLIYQCEEEAEIKVVQVKIGSKP